MDMEDMPIPAFRRRNFLWCWQKMRRFSDCGISSAIYSISNKGIILLGRKKKHALAVFYFALEALSFTLDQLEKGKWGFLLIAFLSSLFVSMAVTYEHIKDRLSPTTKSQAEWQLGVLELAFSVIQLIPISIDFIVVVLGINIKRYKIPCIFPLAFAMIAVAFVFRKDKNSGYGQLPYHKDDLSSPQDVVANEEPPYSDFVPDTSIDLDVSETISTTDYLPPHTDFTPIRTPNDIDLTAATLTPVVPPLHSDFMPTSTSTETDILETAATPVDPLPRSDYLPSSIDIEFDPTETQDYHHPLYDDYVPTGSPFEFDLYDNRMEPTSWKDKRLRKRIPKKSSHQSPRLPWTSKLQARFFHAVEHLGGHEKARPKSVHEHMDVRGLTIDQVKRHLQIHKKVHSKPAVSSDGSASEEDA